MIEKYARFLIDAQAAASKSKDPSTKVGAVILGEDYEFLSSGWNGAPRGSKADEDARYGTRDERLKWAVHAEANAIANAARSGHRLKGSTMVVTHAPCQACSLLIVQAGIIRVIAPAPSKEFQERWGPDFKRSWELFDECGIELFLLP